MKGLKEKLGKVDENKFGYLKQLNFGYNQYAGTVPFETVRKRRAANKVARKSRRINRLRNAA